MIELDVKEMTCSHCVETVTRAVKSLDPRANVEVDLKTKRVRVEGRAAADALISGLNEAGYPAALASAQDAPSATKKGCCCSQ